ncbi:hypothetical protein [Paenarthrobacter sp. AMU7]|uniref:Uncharacterized protein n=1 Tax=Paenarthrobacter sp. AMU7 TaxID=3162492 RepID=A0AB39YI91_9MICC
MNSYNTKVVSRVSKAIQDFEDGLISLDEVQAALGSAASLFENDGTGLSELARTAEADMELVQFTMLQEEQRPAAIWLLDGLRTAMESRGSTL